MMNWIGYGRKQSWPKTCILPQGAMEKYEKPVKTAGVPTEI
jgi:hypothetical protein